MFVNTVLICTVNLLPNTNWMRQRVEDDAHLVLESTKDLNTHFELGLLQVLIRRCFAIAQVHDSEKMWFACVGRGFAAGAHGGVAAAGRRPEEEAGAFRWLLFPFHLMHASIPRPCFSFPIDFPRFRI
eukprot:COSAG05_NODE_5758_length_1095_cov_0.920683_1_plen_128_part_00